MGTFYLSFTMTTFKLISFKLKIEFEIDDTDYDVGWSLDSNVVTENDAGMNMCDNMIEGIFVQENRDDNNVEEFNEVKRTDISENTEDEFNHPVKGEEDKIDQATKKETVFGKQVDLFRESWGLPSEQVQSEKVDEDAAKNDSSDDSNDKAESDALSVKQTIEMNGEKMEGETTIIPMEDESQASKDLVITTEIKIVKGSVEKNDSEEDAKQIKDDIAEGNENDESDHLYEEALETNVEWNGANNTLGYSSGANVDQDSDYQSTILSDENTPEEGIVGGQTKEFTFKLGAGSRSIKLSRKSSDSSPTVFSKSSEGILDDEKIEDFFRAWTDAVIMSLERRVAAGYSVEEVMGGFVMELGLAKFNDIMEHFLGGGLTLQQIEDNRDMD